MAIGERTSSERVHIAFFGRRNVGKSSLVNAVTNQELSVVSDTLGTTTDPVKKSMELLPIGPVLIIDTPGIDDEGELGLLRVKKTREVLATSDVAILVADATYGLTSVEEDLIKLFQKEERPYLIAYNKADLMEDETATPESSATPGNDSALPSIQVSAKNGYHIHELKEAIGQLAAKSEVKKAIVCDLLNEKDTVILVIPVDESAPKDRLILPQQQVLSELLTNHITALCCQPEELSDLLSSLKKKPALVITDSQAFKEVDAIVPTDIALTSFSILFARYKGNLSSLILGKEALLKLKDGDRVLISEGCTHHRQCKDIGTVKLPGWIESYTHVHPSYEFTSGNSFPEDPSEYALVIHCGGCMLNEASMKSRMKTCKEAAVPMINYGVAIAIMHGILDRTLQIFPEL